MSEEKKIKIELDSNDGNIEFTATKNGVERFQFPNGLQAKQKTIELINRTIDEYFALDECCDGVDRLQITKIVE